MLLNFINKLTIFQLWLVSLIVTAAAAEIIVSSFHLLFLGGLSWEYLLTAFVASFISSGMLAAILISKKNLSVLNEYVVNSVSQGVLITDAMRRIIYANRAFEKITGYTGVELVGKSCAILQGEGSDPETIIQMRNALNAAQPFHGEILNYRKDGSTFWNQLSLSPVHNSKGKLIQFVGIQRDITLAKQTQEKLKASQGLVEGIIDNIPVMLFLKRADDLRIEMFNRAGQQLTGYPLDTLLGTNNYDLWPKEQGDIFTAADRKVLASHEITEISEEPITTASGEIRYLHTWKMALRDEAGQPTHLLGISLDITQRKQAEQEIYKLYAEMEQRVIERTESLDSTLSALRDSVTRIKTVLDTVADGIITIDRRGIVETVNPAAERLFGYAAAEIAGQNISMLMPEPYHSQHDGYIERYCASGEARVIGIGRDVQGRRKDGSTFPMYLAVSEMELDGQRHFTGIVHDLTQRKQAELALAEQERFLRGVINIIPGLIAYWTSELRCTFASENYKEWFGKSQQQMHNISLQELMGNELFHQNEPFINGALRGEVQHFERTLIKADGSTGYSWAHYFPDIINGEVRGFFVMVSDITEIKFTQLELEKTNNNLALAKEKADLANRAKDSFLATMSHEIRTPLTGMLGMLEVLSLSPLNHDQEETVQAAWDSARSLLRIVSDILDWSKIEEGKLHLVPQATSIPQLLQEVVNTYSRVASAKSLVLKHTVDNRISPAHIVDGLRLSQVLNNFVSNALKFTHSGEIVVSAMLVNQLESGEQIRFCVKDTGIGISKDAQQKLFRRYQQESVHTARMYGGTGLGLAICQSLVDLMDGEITLESEPGEGSNFCITLTLPVSGMSEKMEGILHPEVMQKKVEPLFDGSENAPLVLAVDDHPINRDLLSRQLRLLGLRVVTAENGGEALLKWREGHFKLVITDCHMPEMDGYAFTRAVRKIEADERLSHIPIIAWTANALPEEVEQCRACGMDDLLVKPVSLAQLKQLLAKWLPIAGTGSNEPIPSKHDADSGHVAGPIDFAVLEQIEPDSAAQIRVLHDFQLHIRTDQTRLLKLLESGDQANVKSMAHRMKGSSRMVGAKGLAEVCAAVEQAAQDGDMAGAKAATLGLDEAIQQFERFLTEVEKPNGKLIKANGLINASELNFLVVEDDDFQRQMIVNMLRSMGAKSVGEADGGKKALKLISEDKENQVDIVICDLNMPEMDGLEFLRNLGEQQHQASIVIVSARGGKLLASAGKMAKMYGMKLLGIIEKPVLREQLKSLLAKHDRSENKWRQPANATSFTLDEILQGIRAKQFEPYFQPKVDFKTGRIVGAEALARWIHPVHGVISPYAFIPLLEQSGNIDDLTFLMLEKAAIYCRSCSDKGLMLTVSVNLSLVTLGDTLLADRIIQVVRNAGLDPRYIMLEITETAAMTDVAHALENLARLSMNGFGLSIDDYGTGYSSMQQLTRIPFSELKIDQSFVKDFSDNVALRIVVESSIDMAHKLEVKSVAEGVETQQEWDMLKNMGCDTAQGYFIAKPMDLASFIEFCAKGSA